MIRRVSDSLPALAEQDVYGARTAGYYQTYGTERNEAAFYVQQTDDGVTAVLSDVFHQGALTVLPNADTEELSALISFLGMETLLCAKETARALSADETENGFVMRYFGTEPYAEISYIDANDPSFSFRDVYTLLRRCAFTLGRYEAWFSDFALRVRRGTASVRCVYRDGVLASTASALFQTGSAVYLGAVATDPAFRGQGFAGALVRSLAKERPRAEILCKAHRVSFYQKLGFEQIGEFSICHFSK